MIGELIQSALKDFTGDDADGKRNRDIIKGPFRVASLNHTIHGWSDLTKTFGKAMDFRTAANEPVFDTPSMDIAA